MSQSQTHTADAPALGARKNFWGESDDSDDDQGDELDDCRRPALLTIARQETDLDAPECHTAAELREEIRDARDDDEDADRPSPCVSASDIAEWKAHQILCQTSPKYSPIAKHAPPFVRSISSTSEAARVCSLTAWLWGGDEDRIERSDRTALHRENVTVEMTEPVLHVPNRYEDGQFGTFDYGQRRYRSRFDPEYGYVTGPVLGDRPAEEFLDLVNVVLANAAAEHSFSESKIDRWRRDAHRMKHSTDYSDEETLATILEEMYDDVSNRGTDD